MVDWRNAFATEDTISATAFAAVVVAIFVLARHTHTWLVHSGWISANPESEVSSCVSLSIIHGETSPLSGRRALTKLVTASAFGGDWKKASMADSSGERDGGLVASKWRTAPRHSSTDTDRRTRGSLHIR